MREIELPELSINESLVHFESAVSNSTRTSRLITIELQRIEKYHEDLYSEEREFSSLNQKISVLDDETKNAHRHFTHMRDKVDSLKNSNIEMKLKIANITEMQKIKAREYDMQIAYMNRKEEIYNEKWNERYTRYYSRHPLFPKNEELKRQYAEIAEYVQFLESEIRQYQADVFRAKCERSRRNAEENGFYPLEAFITQIAELRLETIQMEKIKAEISNNVLLLKREIEKLKEATVLSNSLVMRSNEMIQQEIYENEKSIRNTDNYNFENKMRFHTDVVSEEPTSSFALHSNLALLNFKDKRPIGAEEAVSQAKIPKNNASNWKETLKLKLYMPTFSSLVSQKGDITHCDNVVMSHNNEAQVSNEFDKSLEILHPVIQNDQCTYRNVEMESDVNISREPDKNTITTVNDAFESHEKTSQPLDNNILGKYQEKSLTKTGYPTRNDFHYFQHQQTDIVNEAENPKIAEMKNNFEETLSSIEKCQEQALLKYVQSTTRNDSHYFQPQLAMANETDNPVVMEKQYLMNVDNSPELNFRSPNELQSTTSIQNDQVPSHTYQTPIIIHDLGESVSVSHAEAIDKMNEASQYKSSAGTDNFVTPYLSAETPPFHTPEDIVSPKVSSKQNETNFTDNIEENDAKQQENETQPISPFDFQKHLEALKEMKQSPTYKYPSRLMYKTFPSVHPAASDNSAAPVIQQPANEVFGGMSSFQNTGMSTQNTYSHFTSMEVNSPEKEETLSFSLEDYLDDSPPSPIHVGVEKSMFSFQNASTSNESKKSSSIFQLFGAKSPGTKSPDAVNNEGAGFTLNFGSKQKQQEPNATFKFSF